MGHVRAVSRLLILTGITAPIYAGMLLGFGVAWVVPQAGRRMRRGLAATWARSVLWTMGVRARYEGEPPRTGEFLVANHLSYVDIPLLLAKLDARFLAKAEISRWPIGGILARSAETLFVDRRRNRDLTRVLGEVRGALDGGSTVIVFPEATSTKGAEVLPFKPSLFEVPAKMGVPVSCAALRYATPDEQPAAWQVVCWWGDAAFMPHFYEFLKQPRTDATVVFATRRLASPDRKELARVAHAELRTIFRPTCPPPVHAPEGGAAQADRTRAATEPSPHAP